MPSLRRTGVLARPLVPALRFTMIMLIKRLAKEGFYEIIFVLLMVHREDELLQSANKEMLLELMIDEWKMDRQDELVQKLIYYIE